MVGITQPRRVAASSTAIRVAIEMNCPIFAPNNPTASSAEAGGSSAPDGAAAHKDANKAAKKATKRQRQSLAKGATKRLVGYQVRHDSSTVGPDTKIKFMTDGILLKEVCSSFSIVNRLSFHQTSCNAYFR
jgi:HrpA-like RNA helicase